MDRHNVIGLDVGNRAYKTRVDQTLRSSEASIISYYNCVKLGAESFFFCVCVLPTQNWNTDLS